MSLGNTNKVFLAGGSLASIFPCALLILLFPFVAYIGIQPWIMIFIIVPAISLALLVMPFIYDKIANSDMIFAGRYHLPLAVTTVTLAFFSAMFFGVNSTWHTATQVLILFISLFFATLSFLIFISTISSITNRLIKQDGKTNRYYGVIRNAFAVLGSFALLIAMFVMDFEYSRNLGFIVALTLLAAGFMVYFATKKYLPRFIRIDILPASGIKTVYKSFFSSFSNKQNFKTYLAYFFTTVASSIFILNIMFMNLNALEFIVTLSLFLFMALLCYVLLSPFFAMYFKKFFILGYASEAIGAMIIAIMSFFVLDGSLELGALIPAAALLGFSASVRLASFKKFFSDAVERTSSIRGVIFNLKNLIIFLGAITAFFIMALSVLANQYDYGGARVANYSTVISMAIAILFIVSGPIVILLNLRKKLTLQYPTEEEEMGID
ncbi:MAG: hypothetical protein FWC11_04920 [Firmicutes bacterium]|nr:hypothetical protein [Bacillota bacterium]